MRVPFAPPLHWQMRPSPNQKARAQAVSAIVLHADASSRIESTLDWVRRVESGVSYHVVVSRSGGVYQIVTPDRIAYHAGVSSLNGDPFCNSYSVGVCLSNRNDGDEPYSRSQVMSAVEVCAALCRHYGIPVDRIVTHAAVATPAGRKSDPKGLDVDAFRVAVASLLLPRAA